jgi:hypothetical protein
MRLERVIQTLIVTAGIGVFVYLVTLNVPNSSAKGVIVLSVVVCIFLLWMTGVYFDRRRRRELGEALLRMGLTIGAGAEARYVHRAEKGQRGFEGKFWASGLDPHEPLQVAEFNYTTGRGKQRRTHRNMQVSRPSPGQWPEFRLSKRPGFMRRPLTELIGAQDFGLENEQFTKRWRVECADRDFVVLLLSPIVQDWLMLAPKDENWAIAEGRVCATRQRKCDVPETEALIRRLDEFLRMLPEELAAYEPARGDTFTRRI